MRKDTAVEYYDKIVSDIFQEYVRDEITKTELIVKIHSAYYPALKLEKEQIINAYYIGADEESDRHGAMYQTKEDGIHYYHSTFGS